MTSLPLDNTHGRQRRAWHDITAFGQHTWLDYIGRGWLSSPLDSIHMVRQRRAWHAIISLIQYTRSDDVGRVVLSLSLACTHGRTIFGVAMLSLPLISTHRLMTSGIKCHHFLLDSTHGRRTLTWHAIIAFRLQTLIDDVGSGKP